MFSRRLIVLALLSASLGSACAHGRAAATATGAAVVIVDNRSMDDITVYMVPDGGTRIRIGRLVGLQRQEIKLYDSEIRGVGLVTFVAVPAFGRVSSTDRIHVEPGDTVTLIVSP